MTRKTEAPERRPPEKPSPQTGGNLVWYLVAIAIGAFLVVSLLGKTPIDIPYLDLVRLIEQGPFEKNPKGVIELQEGPEKKRQQVRYSNLRDLRVGTDEITGRVTREVLSPEPSAPRDESFP